MARSLPFDWASIVSAWLPNDPFRPTPGIERVYRVKYELAKRFAPKRIGEIGVRAGYSALAFLQACPDAEYVGFDNNSDSDGGIVGAVHHARGILPRGQATIILADTQRLARLPVVFEEYDLFHVDGRHDFPGCYHDIGLALQASPVVIVDDYDFIPDVKQAVNAYLSDHPTCKGEPVGDGGVRGNMVITRSA